MVSFTEFIQYRKYVSEIIQNDAEYLIKLGTDRSDIGRTLTKTVASGSSIIQESGLDSNCNDYTSIFLDEIELPHDIPKSCIVYNNNNDNKTTDIKLNIKLKAYMLYQKYVQDYTNSHLGINISYDSRNKLDQLMSNKEAWIQNADYNDLCALKCVFDAAAHQVFKLITQIFTRFIKNQQRTTM
mmetsp:Transcript_99471/g.121686  ORF Transcript_99471/g.121686 Transcript_99471/m.121686 type:complete len:184 (-) Transcript_99471:115-666(-)